MPKSKPPYPAEFRQQIIELARAGRTPAQLSREFGPTAQSITNWIVQEGRDRGKPSPGKDVHTVYQLVSANQADATNDLSVRAMCRALKVSPSGSTGSTVRPVPAKWPIWY